MPDTCHSGKKLPDGLANDGIEAYKAQLDTSGGDVASSRAEVTRDFGGEVDVKGR
jgi:hypothetical protein